MSPLASGRLRASAAAAVQVNVIAPGMIKTAFSKPLWDPEVPGGKEMEEEMAGNSLLNRLGTAPLGLLVGRTACLVLAWVVRSTAKPGHTSLAADGTRDPRSCAMAALVLAR